MNPLAFDELERARYIEICKGDDERIEAADEAPAYCHDGMHGYELLWQRYGRVSEIAVCRDDEYGQTWRCWADMPTDADRMAALWDDAPQAI